MSKHGGVTEACRKLSQCKQETGIGDERPVKDAAEEKAADRAKKKKKNRRCVP